ncbi:MAG TPA: hypothetical protein DGL25_02480 [Dehalococcoidia bacterium]|nr:hypothetical protein [Dehalococcoidia bacterium]|tara:strand:+ start:262 stop:990 length:729 start_codon:yes stop_codon:yes gene_type:complete
MSASDLAIISLLSAIAALPQNVAGFGFALVLAPLLVLFLDAGDTVVIVNILAMLSSAAIVWRLRQEIVWPIAGTLFLSSLAGMPLGLLVLLFAEGRVLQVLIAVAVLSGTFALARGLTVGGGNFIAIAAGIAGGILRTSTSAAGPPIIMYLQARNFPIDTFRATGSFFLMSTGVVAIVLYAATNRLDADVGLAVVAAVPGVVIGTIAGGWLAEYVTEIWFRRGVTALLITTALTALVTAILG